MNRRATFIIDDRLRSIIGHAVAHDPDPYYGTKIERSVFLVKDEGIYLMSAGKPGQVNPAFAPGESESQLLVQYAVEADPTKRDRGEVWDDARDIAGGDDFAEPLGIGFFQKAVENGAKQIVVTFTDDKLALETS